MAVLALGMAACLRQQSGALPREIRACPGFESRRAGGADSLDVGPAVVAPGPLVEPALRYPTLPEGNRPVGRVTLEYVLDSTGVPDMRTAWVVQSTGDPFTLAACEALAQTRSVVSTALDGRRLRTIQRRDFTIPPGGSR